MAAKKIKKIVFTLGDPVIVAIKSQTLVFVIL